ncbi:2-oxoglutarate dehydrogenase, E2 component, dihydrolipoamide succinyltransferase [Arthrobacter sp. EH-1B-1]|uniref:Dihydrolipoamide acetyltransferase component of pyruvate dehydrogenase complex n=1 Tax=Arthrobacter vasquezii TaxID=2977629 RepID=A0ABT6CT39_9MICC|nr:2-oxoglutarate dehydrogenase, E2 component, dihydrolipoamide succinyltransferase [Arthrobacter vasquezii]MDF9277222.1 2-oxoglutarate dehydrogenase, E2 component, dihydrolipoamide succinyltransferase [Arthrobacter vasquezii]
MSESVNLPALGESVTEGTVTRWLKQVGDRVEVDEPLLEVSTDKVDTEIPSPIAGVIEEILVAEDETAEVGAPLVRIGDGSGGSDSSDSGDSGVESSSGDAAENAGGDQPVEQSEEEAETPPTQESTEAEGSTEAAGGGQGTEVTLPALGESVTEGTVTRWLKAVGDDVEVDEPLLEVSTDKVDTEIPSPVAGTLQEIRVNEDETAEVGSVLAVIGSAGAAPAQAEPKSAEPVAAAPSAEREEPTAEPEAARPDPEPQPEPSGSTEPTEAKEAPAPAKSPSDEATGSDSVYVTPLVRKLANQHGVDLSSIKGTGVGGRIRKQDVLEAAESSKASQQDAPSAAPSAPAPAPAAAPAASKLRGTVEKAPRIRQTIARRMRESLEVSAQLTQVIEVDMTRVARLRAKAKETFQAQNSAKLTFLPFIAKAVTEALKQHAKLNASFDEEAKEVTYHDAEHLAIAVDTEKGLLVPVINDAGNLNLAGLAKKIADVGARTRSGKIGPDELSGGTFTITNIGSVGALFDTPIINQPQVGILGTGAIVKRPVVVTDADGDDTIAIRSMMYLSLTYDHRLVDGADAGRFLQALKSRLEEGAFEADLGL